MSSMALASSMCRLVLLILNSALAICWAKEPPSPPSVLMKGKTFSLTWRRAWSAGSWVQCDQRSFTSGKIGWCFLPRSRAARSASCSRSSRRFRNNRNESCSIASSGLESPPDQSLSQRASTFERSVESVSMVPIYTNGPSKPIHRADGLQYPHQGRDGCWTYVLANEPTRFINHRNLRQLAVNIQADKMLELHGRLLEKNDESAGCYMLLPFSLPPPPPPTTACWSSRKTCGDPAEKDKKPRTTRITG